MLAVLWDSDDWLTPREVHDRLDPVNPVGYTTVMTVLVRLWKKGHLDRRKAGRAFAYQSCQTREQYVAERMERLLAATVNRAAALSHFVERLEEHERAQLEDFLIGRKR